MKKYFILSNSQTSFLGEKGTKAARFVYSILIVAFFILMMYAFIYRYFANDLILYSANDFFWSLVVSCALRYIFISAYLRNIIFYCFLMLIVLLTDEVSQIFTNYGFYNLTFDINDIIAYILAFIVSVIIFKLVDTVIFKIYQNQ